MKQLTQGDQDFIRFCIKELGIETSPNISISDDHGKAQELRAMGCYYPAEQRIWVLRGSRVPADWYRTLAHELVHWRQRERGESLDGADGSPTENEANSLAGSLLRAWGRETPAIYVIEEEVEVPLGTDLPFDGDGHADGTGEPMVPYSV